MSGTLKEYYCILGILLYTRQMETYGGNFTESTSGSYIKFYSENADMEVIAQGQGREIIKIYIGGSPYQSNIVYLQSGGGGPNGKYVFLHKDYLGSTLAYSDEQGQTFCQAHYDAWGNQVVKQNFAEDGVFFLRGYTGHEFFEQVGIIHMNGRLYDPAMHTFLNADEYIQDIYNTQCYNKYGYVLNNPLMYTDPSGEIFGMIFGFLSDLFNNLFIRTFKWEKWDWTQTKQGWLLDAGLFVTDPNKNFFGRVWEFLSRITWQLPQTLVGDLFVSGANAFGAVKNVSYGYGMTAVDMGLKDGNAVTIGFYSAGPTGYRANWRDHLFVHEYGHYIQSQQHGPVFLFTVGIPSLQSTILQTDNQNTPRHDNRWFEADASYKGAAYFDKYYGSGKEGYVAGSIDYFDRESFINGSTMSSTYVNPRTGTVNTSDNPISGKFHWTDIPIYIPIIGLFPYLFYIN